MFTLEVRMMEGTKLTAGRGEQNLRMNCSTVTAAKEVNVGLFERFFADERVMKRILTRGYHH